MDELEVGNDYHSKYFDGRITENDKDFATSKIIFCINDQEIMVKRSFFPSQILEYTFNGESRNVEDFEADIVKTTKLNNYAQFVFLQLKVLTFDEGRDCLFWNPSVLTPTIFLCLGKNVENADRADELARELQKISSRIRNVQWDITKQNNRLTTLIEEKSVGEKNGQEYSKEEESHAKNEYEYIEKQLEKIETERDELIAEQQLVYAKTSEATIEKLKLEDEYQETYSRLYAEKVNLRRNPLIVDITSKGCPICRTQHSTLPGCIEEQLKNNICPLCGEKIAVEDSATDEIIETLQKIDCEVKSASGRLADLAKRSISISKRIDELGSLMVSLTLGKEKIEQQNYKFLTTKSTDDAWGARIKTLQESIRQIEQEKAQHVTRRDTVKKEYDSLCLNLENAYQEVQVGFLPIFKKFAKEFTGLDLDMILNSVTDDGRRQFKFALQIDDTNRDNEFELSESQRFFIDIALRMSMISYVCSDHNNCSMLIDTPEGSLDIAYETNAGAMFSEYINTNQNMILTANLNSSGLIRTLAEKTKAEKFNLINMLKWAKLSSVQSHHLTLFSDAIAEIQKRLEG